ncbi:MAG: tetratricopeptide repeat protein [Cyanobium sp.]
MALNPAATRDRIFISYRREDSRGATGRVWDWLRIGFGRERVFRDVASIGAGKWRIKIDEALAASTACVAVIGRRWADATNLLRLQDPNDVVRHELEMALAQGEHNTLAVIPLLVDDVQLNQIPTDALPASVQPLFREWNVLTLSDAGWDDDTRRLIEAIADATGLAVNPELGDWLLLLGGARKGLAAARWTDDREISWRQRDEPALNSLLHRAARSEPVDRPALKDALAALAAGNTLLAEASFEQELLASQESRLAAQELLNTAQQREAEAAANIASLAVVRGDLVKATTFYQQALQANPLALDTALDFAYAWISRGDLVQARNVLTDLISRCTSAGELQVEARARRGLGEVLALQGERAPAMEAFQTSLKILAALAANDPDNREVQRDRAITLHRIGDGRAAQGSVKAALEAFGEALEISGHLALADPANSQWQRDLSVSQDKVAGMLLAQGEQASALAHYQASLRVRQDLAGRDPANSQWKRDVSVSHEKIGDLLWARGDGAAALGAHQASLRIRQGLVGQDPANRQWQRDLSVSHEKVGALLLEQGHGAEALTAFEASLSIRQSLLRTDPTNRQWQRDCFVAQTKRGDGLLATGDLSAGQSAYQGALAIAEALTRLDPDNTQWRRDLYVAKLKMADSLIAQNERDAAEVLYRDCHAIATSLIRLNPANPGWQLDLVIACTRLGSVEVMVPAPERRLLLLQGRETVMALQNDGQPEEHQEWITWFNQALDALH